jgi:hypothetical protein
MLLLAEQPTAFTLLGLAGITLGIVMIAGGPALWRRAHRPQERARVHAGLRWGAATGALIAGRLLGEEDRGWRMVGAACMAVGVAALAWG